MSEPDQPHERTAGSHVLARTGLLDIRSDVMLDQLMKLVATSLNAPFSLISLCSDNHLWIKSRHGTDQDRVSLNQMVFELTRELDDVLIVADLKTDERFEAIPSLQASTKRSFLGYPLFSVTGERIGTVCVMDTMPRGWTEQEIDFLAHIASVATAHIKHLERQSLVEKPDAAEVSDPPPLDTEAHLLDSISRIANIGGWTIDIDTGHLFWTQQTKAIHEVDEDYVPVLSEAVKFFAEDGKPLIIQAVRTGMNTGQPWDLELPLITARGNRKWVRAVGECEFRNGEPARLIGTFQDITEQRRRREELQAARYSEQRARQNLATYLSAIEEHLIVVVTSSDGRVSFVNEKFCEISGYRADELLGNTLGKLNSHMHSHDFYLEMRQQIKAGKAWHGEICNRRKDGSLFWLETTIVPREKDEGQPADFVNICVDITDWVNHRIDLEKRRSDAEDATNAKTRFLASMSHEIRTPLNGVIALAGALSATSLSQDQREMVDLILKSGEGLNAILSDILDISRIEEGKFTVQSDPFNFSRSVETVVGLLNLVVEEKGLTLTTQIDPKLNRIFRGDEIRIRQILSNLLSNAIKFTDEGSIIIKSALVTDPAGSHRVRTSVEDTGVGMTPSEAARIFQRFEQGDASLSRSHRGVGLGLWICNHLCELMGGRIWVESELGRGSRFVFDIPLQPVEGAATHDRVETSAKSTGKGQKVLLAEDHMVNQRVFALILNAAGFELDIVDNGQKAYDHWLENDYAVVLMDLQMPRVDGLTATRMIRQHEERFGLRRTPIAAISANAMQEHVRASLEAGADLHISKPVTPEDLLNGISALMTAGARSAAQSSGQVP